MLGKDQLGMLTSSKEAFHRVHSGGCVVTVLRDTP